jgi:hypothetical protein
MKIIVCLSTIPSRVEYLHLTVQSLLDQTIKPDIIYVFIPKWSIKEQCIYPQIDSEFVHMVEQDEGPVTKLYPIFQLVPEEQDTETLVINVDDDQMYNTRTIESLIYAYQRCKSRFDVVGFSGWILRSWTKTRFPLKAIPVDWPEATSAVLYPMIALRRMQKDILKFDLLPEARSCDDIWIAAWIQQRTPDCTIYAVPLLGDSKSTHKETAAVEVNSLSNGITSIDDKKVQYFKSKCKMLLKNRRVALTLKQQLNVFHSPVITDVSSGGKYTQHFGFYIHSTIIIVLLFLIVWSWLFRKKR